jgi:hypothetical protein
MAAPFGEYEAHYLAGVLFFNAHDYFEAHEVWEEAWAHAAGAERRFYQGLIHAAVGLFHFGNGNLRGAVKLYHSSRDYLRDLGPVFLGLDMAGFGGQMDRCFASIRGPSPPDPGLRPQPELLPHITLDPPPAQWPDPEGLLPSEEES